LKGVIRIRQGEAIWKGEIGSELTFDDVINDLRYFEEGGYDSVLIHLQSIGGILGEAVSMINRIKSSSLTITFVVDSFVGSAGTLLAISGDRLLMPENAKFAIHNCYKPVVYDVDLTTIESLTTELKELNSISKKMYLKKANNITEEKLSELMDKTTYLSAEDCLKYGFCDKVIDPSDVYLVGREISQKLLELNPDIKQKIVIDDFKGIKKVVNEPVYERSQELQETFDYLRSIGLYFD